MGKTICAVLHEYQTLVSLYVMPCVVGQLYGGPALELGHQGSYMF